MNRANREKVMKFLTTVDTSPLIFELYQSPNCEQNHKKFTVEDMVRRALRLSYYHKSCTLDGEIVCQNDRWRSSLDIWRHIKFFYPHVEIFDVLNALYEIQNECGGQFCDLIGRRTFKLKGMNGMGECWSNCQDFCDNDEYGLSWKDWEGI